VPEIKPVINPLILFEILLGTILVSCSQSIILPTPTVFYPQFILQATQLTQSIDPTPSTPQPHSSEICVNNGKVERYQIDSNHLSTALFFSVYFPPCYSDMQPDGYPTLYALHGQNFTDEMWIDLGAAEKMDKLILEGEIEPFLMVMPFEEYFFREAEGNQFPLALSEEIIPWVEGNLNVCTKKNCRAIAGISRGASWAVRIGLSEWKDFGSIGAHSLPTFRKDIDALPDWLAAISSGKEPRFYMDTGRFDPEVKTASRFEQVLNEKGFPHEWHLNDGRHNEAYWEEHMIEYLRWYAAGWDIE
jgi:enterochelin esterase-like enzyme